MSNTWPRFWLRLSLFCLRISRMVKPNPLDAVEAYRVDEGTVNGLLVLLTRELDDFWIGQRGRDTVCKMTEEKNDLL